MEKQIKTNIELTKALEAYINEKVFDKLEKFNKYIEDVVVRINSLNNEVFEATVLINLMGQQRYNKVSSKDSDLYRGLDSVSDKAIRKVRKFKEKHDYHTSNNLETLTLVDVPVTHNFEEEEYKIAKIKRFNIKPMFVEEAIAQMEMLKHSFFFYFDASIDRPCVVYKRKNNTYGIIESEY